MSNQKLHQKLSPRELEVMYQVALGHSNKQIAEQIGVRYKTVSTYKHRMLKKMQMKSVNEIIRYSVLNQIIA